MHRKDKLRWPSEAAPWVPLPQRLSVLVGCQSSESYIRNIFLSVHPPSCSSFFFRWCLLATIPHTCVIKINMLLLFAVFKTFSEMFLCRNNRHLSIKSEHTPVCVSVEVRRRPPGTQMAVIKMKMSF